MSNYLGQHFLKNKKKLQEIIDALDLARGDIVIEIGPGKGALTIPLAEKCGEFDCKIIAIEKDGKLANELKEKFKSDKNIGIIEGDILKILPKLISDYGLQAANYKIVGNIPYYITGYLFRILGELEIKPNMIVLLIQKEVAERVCAKPPRMNLVRNRTSKMSDGRFQRSVSNGMNLLAASVQFWAKPEIVGYVSKKDFSPPPKVESAIIKLTPFNFATPRRSKQEQNKIIKNQNKLVFATARCSKENYYKFIKILFKQPRKTILNNLRPIISDQQFFAEKLKEIGINPQVRPQDLSLEQIKQIMDLKID